MYHRRTVGSVLLVWKVGCNYIPSKFRLIEDKLLGASSPISMFRDFVPCKLVLQVQSSVLQCSAVQCTAVQCSEV